MATYEEHTFESVQKTASCRDNVSLEDKWVIDNGRVVMNGAQAIARILLAQATLDRTHGLSTAGYITGYRGSPLGNVDTALWSIGKRLASANILFQPALNEDIAATAVRGTQQLDAVPGALYDGVFAAWYGKGPGVDRSGDAFKHGNYAGTHPNGGVLVFYGDDHASKSSTVAHQSEQAVAASLIPSLYPANVQELMDFGLIGFALSRYSGSWVGIKCVTEVAEQTATLDLNLANFMPIRPPRSKDLPSGIHNEEGAFNPLRQEQIVVECRLPLVHAFLRANGVDKIVIDSERPTLGLMTAGKTYGDVCAALALLGLDQTRAAALGITLYKVGCIWPLEPTGLIAFARELSTLFVVEEKKSFLEQQAAAILINAPLRPLLIGKTDEKGDRLLSSVQSLEPPDIARAIAGRLEHLGILDNCVRAARDTLNSGVAIADPLLKRSPFFCSGCPHSRSTRIPEGSLSMTGIGCHTIANFVRPKEALLPTQMGGEGGNWIGLAPFTKTEHIFQNMGDGTYYHSGLLAIRAAIAAGVNITYKILYNDAVAMTGGQPVGNISVASIAHQVRSEGVKRVVILSDNPTSYRGNPDLPSGIVIEHRDELDRVQRELRETTGCSVLIYEQICAAEKRRRRKRGVASDPAKRLFISQAVCEGCGDCSAQSTCVSLVPVETEFGRKRAIDQSSCNKDYSCINGFCPSFITVYDAEPRRPQRMLIDKRLCEDLPTPIRASIGQNGFNLMIAGIGGTGVVTVGALIGMAAHLDGLSMSLFDMTGISQKNGAVYSHVQIARAPKDLRAQRLAQGEADVLLAFDLVAALSQDSSIALNADRTQAIVNADISPTAAFQFDRDFSADPALLTARLQRKIKRDALSIVDASTITLALLGDTIGTNLFIVGVAVQQGLLPVGVTAIERAIALNGVAVSLNITALRLGRLFAAYPERVLAEAKRVQPATISPPTTLSEVVAHRMRHLTEYQNLALAERYRSLVDRVRTAEERVLPGSQTAALAVAINYASLLAYKDEYEVARLLSSPTLREEIRRTFGDGSRIAFNLAAPLLSRRVVNGRPQKREFGAWVLPVMRMLTRLRSLRGTVFDIFGWSMDRRTERSLIREYEALTETILDGITPGNQAQAVALLSMAGEIRGYGLVKAAAVETYRARISAALQTYRPLSSTQVTEIPTRRCVHVS